MTLQKSKWDKIPIEKKKIQNNNYYILIPVKNKGKDLNCWMPVKII